MVGERFGKAKFQFLPIQEPNFNLWSQTLTAIVEAFSDLGIVRHMCMPASLNSRRYRENLDIDNGKSSVTWRDLLFKERISPFHSFQPADRSFSIRREYVIANSSALSLWVWPCRTLCEECEKNMEEDRLTGQLKFTFLGQWWTVTMSWYLVCLRTLYETICEETRYGQDPW